MVKSMPKHTIGSVPSGLLNNMKSPCSFTQLKTSTDAHVKKANDLYTFDQHSVSQRLFFKPPSEPEHCLELYTQYSDWCTHHGRLAIAQYSFYTRLVELGARKFREGRNGPTKYELPYASITRAIAK